MEQAPQDTVQALQDKLLKSFPNSTFRGIILEIDSGYSGSSVFAVHYEKKNKYGLNGTFIVKIGPEAWAIKEQEFYDSLPEDDRRSTLLTEGHMYTPPLEGQVAVAYEVAFKRLITPKTLMKILDEGKKSEKEAQRQIKALAHALVDWYINEHCVSHGRVTDCYMLLRSMLTEERAKSLLSRLGEFLPFWRSDTLHITVDGLDRRLPNPLAYEEICRKISMHPVCPICRIHGDLHTGNVICADEANLTPKLIDFEQSTPDGVPFFDLAYLEFDIMRHLLPVKDAKKREAWLELLNESMSELHIQKEPLSWEASRTWPFLAPIREEVGRLQQQMEGESYELVWWLATVAVGLNFARKGDHTRSAFERMAGLLYAAYGLDHILKMFEVKDLSTQESVQFVPWIQGIAEASAAPTEEKSPASLVEGIAEIAVVNDRAVQEPQFDLARTAPEPGKEQSEGNPPGAPVGVAEFPPDAVEEKRPDTEQNAKGFSASTADGIRLSLQEAVDLFQKKGTIYKDRCTSTDRTLQLLETFLQELLPNSNETKMEHVFFRQSLLELQKDIHKDLLGFRESCPPAPARKLAQADYDRECSVISNKLERLQAKFLEFLGKFH